MSIILFMENSVWFDYNATESVIMDAAEKHLIEIQLSHYSFPNIACYFRINENNVVITIYS